MRILQLTHKFPYPYHDGGAIAVRALAEGLHKCGVEIDLFSLNTDKHLATQQQIEEFKTQAVYSIIKSNPIHTTESKSGAIWNALFMSNSYFISRFYKIEIAHELKNHLDSIAYYAIIIESLYMVPYFNELRKSLPVIPIVLRAHNIEFELRSRQKEEERDWFRKLYLASEIKKLKKYELDSYSKVDLIATVSAREAEKLKNEFGVEHAVAIPIGMALKKSNIRKQDSEIFKIGFIGSLNWRPNVEGLRWFTNSVWNSNKKHDGIQCFIAGAYAGMEIDFLKETDINYLGRVDNSQDFMRSLDLLIVPLFSGSGTRVKILEAMSLGVPVLSTSLGAEGIGVDSNKNILLADTQKEWVETINRYSKSQSDLIRISNNAKVLIKEKYNVEDIGIKLKKEIDQVVRGKMKLKSE